MENLREHSFLRWDLERSLQYCQALGSPEVWPHHLRTVPTHNLPEFLKRVDPALSLPMLTNNLKRPQLAREVLAVFQYKRDQLRAPLFTSAYLGPSSTVQLLLEAGAVVSDVCSSSDAAALPVDEGDVQGMTALSFAAQAGREDIVKLLLENGGVVTVPRHDGYLPLHLAAGRGHAKAIRTMITIGKADPDTPEPNGATALHLAALGQDLDQNGHLEAACALLDCGAAVDLKTQQAGTPLHVAAARGDLEIVRLLLARGADATLPHGNHTPLIFAAMSNHHNIIPLLIAHGADPNQKGGNGTPLLHAVVKLGNVDATRALLDGGGNVNRKDTQGRPLLHKASTRALVQLILKRGADVAAADATGKPALHAAAALGWVEAVHTLLDAGSVNPNSLSNGCEVPPCTALHYAAIEGHRETVRVLLDAGATINSPGATPGLYVASHKGDTEMVKLLLEHGADISTTGTGGHTAMGAAIASGHVDIAALLKAEETKRSEQDQYKQFKSDPERLRAAQHSREQGATLFKQQQYDDSRACFVQALATLEQLSDTSNEETAVKKKEISLSCHLNVASCSIKTGAWKVALNNATSALAYDANNPKAFFRRGQAKRQLRDFKGARADLEKSKELTGGDAGVMAELESLSQDETKEKNKEKQMFGKMFS